MLRFGTILLVGIAVGGFEVALGGKFYGSAVPCPPGQPCAAVQPFYPLKPKSRRPALSAKYAYKKKSSRDPCISDFVCTFVDKVHKCSELVQLFSAFDHTSAEEFCYGKYPEILDTMIGVGAPNPEFAAQQAVESIGDCFDDLSSDIVIEVYANSIAKYLFTQGILTPQNAVQLAKQYADTMYEAAKCNDSEYAALNEGFVNFLDSLGLFTADKALLISLQYANEWKMVAKQPQPCPKPKYG